MAPTRRPVGRAQGAHRRQPVVAGRGSTHGPDGLDWTRGHRLLQDRANHDLGFRLTVLGDIVTGPVTDRIAVLTGPRRIGKSVALLDTAAALCTRTDVDPRQVIHLPCDGLRDRDLRRSLTPRPGADRPHTSALIAALRAATLARPWPLLARL